MHFSLNRKFLGTVVLLSLLLVPGLASAQDPNDPLLTWRFYLDEYEIESSMLFRPEAPILPEPLVLTNVVIVELPEGRLLPDHAVSIRNGRIEWVGPASELNVSPDSRSIDGGGRYLAPGLIEMHAHTLTTSADYLTQVGAGVTTIREMDGFPWLLKRKKQADSGQLFAPTMFVTGMILNGSDFGGICPGCENPGRSQAGSEGTGSRRL